MASTFYWKLARSNTRKRQLQNWLPLLTIVGIAIFLDVAHPSTHSLVIAILYIALALAYLQYQTLAREGPALRQRLQNRRTHRKLPFRYAGISMDTYILEELRRRYSRADKQGRLRLLRRLLAKRGGIPRDVAMLAVEDSDVRVREWMARFAPISLNSQPFEELYGGFPQEFRGELIEQERFHREVAAKLRNDPDPFVRACLFENPHAFRSDVDLASGLERFALARNPRIADALGGHELLGSVLDLDRDLEISFDARREVALAMVSNRTLIRKSHFFRLHGSHEFEDKLWKLAAKWPINSGIPGVVFGRIEAADRIKREMYTKFPELRDVILSNCTWRDRETLNAALLDEDESRQRIAYEKLESAATPA